MTNKNFNTLETGNKIIISDEKHYKKKMWEKKLQAKNKKLFFFISNSPLCRDKHNCMFYINCYDPSM